METAKEVVQHELKSVNIDSLDEKVRKQYPLLADISAALEGKKNEIKEMVHAFYEGQKTNIKVGKENVIGLDTRFVKLWQEKKRLEQLEFQEKAKTPEYQAMFASLRSKKQNAQDTK